MRHSCRDCISDQQWSALLFRGGMHADQPCVRITMWKETTEMKIIIKETCIEADARELRESNTLAGNFANLLSRCFASTEPFDDEEDHEGEE